MKTNPLKPRIQRVIVGLVFIGMVAFGVTRWVRDTRARHSVGVDSLTQQTGHSNDSGSVQFASAGGLPEMLTIPPAPPVTLLPPSFDGSQPIEVDVAPLFTNATFHPNQNRHTTQPTAFNQPCVQPHEMYEQVQTVPQDWRPQDNAGVPEWRGAVGQSGFQPHLTVIPERPARSAEEIRELIDKLTTPDAQFEVVLGQARLLTLRRDLATVGKPSPVLAIGDPSIIALEVMPNPRLLRVTGLRPGITDIVITTSLQETYTLQAHVIFNLVQVQHWLRQLFPDAHLKLSQFHEHIVVEGEARNMSQAEEILNVVRAYLTSMQANRGTASRNEQPQQQQQQQPRNQQGQGQNRGQSGNSQQRPQPAYGDDEQGQSDPQASSHEGSSRSGGGGGRGGDVVEPQIINRIRVPGPQQILLKVQVAELNRTSLRQIGSDLLFSHGGNTFGTQLGGAANVLPPGGNGGSSASFADGTSLMGMIATGPASGATAFGIVNGLDTQVFLSVLRSNSVLKILAEPNLVAMNGHKATFLAGGEFPIPVNQGGASGAVSVQFREFGVRLAFEPFDLGDKRIRLAVSSEVSSVDFSLGTTLVAGGQPVPGLSTRNVQTTVELTEGKTLMMAGLLQVSMDGTTKRIPGLGELPTIGTMFRNNTGRRQEKELIVLVTPHLVEGVNENELPRLPGEEVGEPNELDFYLRGKIEDRCGKDFRTTTNIPPVRTFRRDRCLEKNYVKGAHGYSE